MAFFTISSVTQLALRGFSGSTLCEELLDDFLKVWITGAEAPREPIAAALCDFFTVRYHFELASFARRANSLNAEALLDQGHETRDLGTIVVSSWTMNDFDLHTVLYLT